MIFWYCHFAEPQKRYYQKMPPVLSNNPYQNILNWLWNDSWTNCLLMTAELECHSRIEMVNETQLGKVQMKRPTYGLCLIHWATTRMRYKHGLKTNHRFGIQLTTYMGGFICTPLSWLSVTRSSSQCSWTRMASQMIECYQLRCHFAEPQKR